MYMLDVEKNNAYELLVILICSYLPTSHSTDPSVSPCVEVTLHLYLVIPQKGAHETHLMTLGNYKQLVPKFRESFLFQFDAKTVCNDARNGLL